MSRHDLLPAVCLRCGEPGTRARELRAPRMGPPKAIGRTGYYCETCDEEDRSWSTRAFAWRMALGVLLAAVSASVVFRFGDGDLFYQGAIVMLGGVTATSLLELLFARARPRRALFHGASDHSDGVLWLPDSEGARAVARALEPRKATKANFAAFPLSASMFAPLALSVGLLTVAHTTLGATLVVLDHEGDSVLLVDHRLRAHVESVQTESPSRLKTLRVFSGSRQVTWIGANGQLRLDEAIALEPGQIVLLAMTPPGLCLFLESQTYGAAGNDHFLAPLGPGPIYHLDPPPEHWLSPIPPAEATTSRGGRLTALRLLPCTGVDERSHRR